MHSKSKQNHQSLPVEDLLHKDVRTQYIFIISFPKVHKLWRKQSHYIIYSTDTVELMDQRDDWSISNIFYKSEFPIHLQSPWLFFRNTAQFLEISDSLKKKKSLYSVCLRSKVAECSCGWCLGSGVTLCKFLKSKNKQKRSVCWLWPNLIWSLRL